MNAISERQRVLHERLEQATRTATRRVARGNVNLFLGRFATKEEIKARLLSAASYLKNVK